MKQNEWQAVQLSNNGMELVFKIMVNRLKSCLLQTLHLSTMRNSKLQSNSSSAGSFDVTFSAASPKSSTCLPAGPASAASFSERTLDSGMAGIMASSSDRGTKNEKTDNSPKNKQRPCFVRQNTNNQWQPTPYAPASAAFTFGPCSDLPLSSGSAPRDPYWLFVYQFSFCSLILNLENVAGRIFMSQSYLSA